MCEAGLVGKTECSCHFGCDFCGLTRVYLTAASADIGEGVTLNVFHSNEIGRFKTTPVINVDDIGVSETSSRLGFPPETFNELWIDGKLGKKHFYGDIPRKQLIAR